MPFYFGNASNNNNSGNAPAGGFSLAKRPAPSASGEVGFHLEAQPLKMQVEMPPRKPLLALLAMALLLQLLQPLVASLALMAPLQLQQLWQALALPRQRGTMTSEDAAKQAGAPAAAALITAAAAAAMTPAPTPFSFGPSSATGTSSAKPPASPAPAPATGGAFSSGGAPKDRSILTGFQVRWGENER